MLRCNQRMKFSGKRKFGKKEEDGEKRKKGGGRKGKRKKGGGLFLWRSDEKGKGAGFELVKEIGMERKR